MSIVYFQLSPLLSQYAAVISGTLSKSVRKLYLYNLESNETETISLEDYSGAHDLTWTPTSDLLSFIVDNSNDTSSVMIYSISLKTFSVVVTYPVTISNVRWGDSGKIFVFTATVYPGKTLDETRSIDDLKASDTNSASFMQFDKTMVYHWDEYILDTRQHIFYSNISTNFSNPSIYSISSDAVDIIGSIMADSPTKPTGFPVAILLSLTSCFFFAFIR